MVICIVFFVFRKNFPLRPQYQKFNKWRGLCRVLGPVLACVIYDKKNYSLNIRTHPESEDQTAKVHCPAGNFKTRQLKRLCYFLRRVVLSYSFKQTIESWNLCDANNRYRIPFLFCSSNWIIYLLSDWFSVSFS